MSAPATSVPNGVFLAVSLQRMPLWVTRILGFALHARINCVLEWPALVWTTPLLFTTKRRCINRAVLVILPFPLLTSLSFPPSPPPHQSNRNRRNEYHPARGRAFASADARRPRCAAPARAPPCPPRSVPGQPWQQAWGGGSWAGQSAWAGSAWEAPPPVVVIGSGRRASQYAPFLVPPQVCRCTINLGARPEALLPSNLQRVIDQPPAEQSLAKFAERVDALASLVASFQLATAFAQSTLQAKGRCVCVCVFGRTRPTSKRPEHALVSPRIVDLSEGRFWGDPLRA